MKIKRRALLTELLQSGDVRTQRDAVLALERLGILATQTTVSRDLAEIGAIRILHGGKAKYLLPNDSTPVVAPLKRIFKEFVIRQATSGNLIVLGTPPGHAGVVAAAIDRAAIAGILGVVAGDDTLFVCCDESQGATTVLDRLIGTVNQEA